MTYSFLSLKDPDPVTILNENAHPPFLLICDHAGIAIPEFLNELGLTVKDRYRHIAWDIGIKGVGEKLAYLLQSTLVLQNYSRLVIDCNRALNNPTLIPVVSDHVVVNGNQFISEGEKNFRIQAIYQFYHNTIENLIKQRLAQKRKIIFIALHSFTPEMDGFQRPWHAGILHNRYDEFALIFKKYLEKNYAYPIGDNEPYALTEKNDYTVPYHVFKRKLPYLELEIRQDLITTELQQQEWAERLAFLLPKALTEYEYYDINHRKG